MNFRFFISITAISLSMTHACWTAGTAISIHISGVSGDNVAPGPLAAAPSNPQQILATCEESSVVGNDGGASGLISSERGGEDPPPPYPALGVDISEIPRSTPRPAPRGSLKTNFQKTDEQQREEKATLGLSTVEVQNATSSSSPFQGEDGFDPSAPLESSPSESPPPKPERIFAYNPEENETSSSEAHLGRSGSCLSLLFHTDPGDLEEDKGVSRKPSLKKRRAPLPPAEAKTNAGTSVDGSQGEAVSPSPRPRRTYQYDKCNKLHGKKKPKLKRNRTLRVRRGYSGRFYVALRPYDYKGFSERIVHQEKKALREQLKMKGYPKEGLLNSSLRERESGNLKHFLHENSGSIISALQKEGIDVPLKSDRAKMTHSLRKKVERLNLRRVTKFSCKGMKVSSDNNAGEQSAGFLLGLNRMGGQKFKKDLNRRVPIAGRVATRRKKYGFIFGSFCRGLIAKGAEPEDIPWFFQKIYLTKQQRKDLIQLYQDTQQTKQELEKREEPEASEPSKPEASELPKGRLLSLDQRSTVQANINEAFGIALTAGAVAA